MHFSKTKYRNVKIIEDGGWHFSNLKSPEDIEDKMLNFGHHNEIEDSGIGLKDNKSLEIHRISNILSNENLLYKITLFSKVQKYCDINYSEYINKSFYNQKENIDSVKYSLIRVKEYGLSKELYYRIKDDNDNFNQIARDYSVGVEKETSGLIGPLSLDKVHPKVREKLKKSLHLVLIING